jgi:hypothetical protein
LAVKFSSGGVSSYPDVGEPALSLTTGVVAGNTRYFQQWYRDAFTFCTSWTFNLTNGLQVTWLP